MLEIWLDLNANLGTEKQWSVAPGGYEIVLVGEREHCDTAGVRYAIRKWLRGCYASFEYAGRRASEGAYGSLEDVYQLEKFPSENNVMVRHGDFGEAVGHFVLEAHPSLAFWLPVFRLRHKTDRDKALFGFDLIGFRLANADGDANVLCIGEVRLRTTPQKKVIAQAHHRLASYTRSREIEQTGRIAQWLFDEGRREESDKLAIFGEGWARPEFERRHVFVGILDKTLSLEEMIGAMNEEREVLDTFIACLVVVDRLRYWIEEAYKP